MMIKMAKLAAAMLLGCCVPLSATQAARRPAGVSNRDQEAFQAVAKLEDEMRLAILKGTAGWWVEHLSEGFTGTDPHGKISNRAQTIELERSADLVYDTWNLSDRAVHIFNGNTVIVTGRVTVEGTYHGQSLSGDFQFTRVWVKNGVLWELAASQMTRISS